MKLVIANTEIHQESEGRFSLNDLHRASGGEDKNKPSNFLRSEQTQKLIEAINRCSDSSSGSSDSINALSTKEGGKNQGSYGVKELVYAYAMWISSRFHLQVIRTFDAVKKHAKAEDLVKREALTAGGKQRKNFINERGMWRLVMKSEPSTRTVSDWSKWRIFTS